jgi:hypothetical protein
MGPSLQTIIYMIEHVVETPHISEDKKFKTQASAAKVTLVLGL